MKDEGPERIDALVVGAGVAGLSCASRLAAAGRRTVVLEKSRGLGGRCATRRVEGQPVDHGPAFLHGDDPDFLAALDRVEGARLEGWPRHVVGRGTPCRPAAFRATERRLSFVEGLTDFAKDLGRDVEVRREVRIVSLGLSGPRVEARAADGAVGAAPTLVLALPVPRAAELLEALGPRLPDHAAILHLLRSVVSMPCLTLIAGYRGERRGPDWDVAYPGDSAILQVISHDSSKRRAPRFTVLVCQARADWSRRSWDRAEAAWRREILAEAARVAGPWAAEPDWVQVQRWRHGQVGRASELNRPLLLTLAEGARIGVTGDGFGAGGGLQGAWSAGRRLAGRLLRG